MHCWYLLLVYCNMCLMYLFWCVIQESQIAQTFQKHLKNQSNTGIDELRLIMEEVQNKQNELRAAANKTKSSDVDIDMIENERNGGIGSAGNRSTLQKAMSIEGEDKDDQKISDLDHKIAIKELDMIRDYVKNQIVRNKYS